MEYAKENVLNFSNPEQFGCQVFFYHKQHSYLLIAIYDKIKQERRYFHFVAVEYFEGPMVWTGCSINIASMAEHRRLSKKLGLDITKYSPTSHLYIIEGSNSNIKILADSVNEDPDISKSFPYVYKYDED